MICDRCRKPRPAHDLTEQRDGEVLCSRCVNELNVEIREENRRARAAAPRCECCGRRGTWRLRASDGTVLLCGHHKKRVERERIRRTHGGAVALLSLPAPTRAGVFELAR